MKLNAGIVTVRFTKKQSTYEKTCGVPAVLYTTTSRQDTPLVPELPDVPDVPDVPTHTPPGVIRPTPLVIETLPVKAHILVVPAAVVVTGTTFPLQSVYCHTKLGSPKLDF